MEKTILTILVIFTLISCSKDDDGGNKQLELNYNNLFGTWYPYSVVKANDEVQLYTTNCSTKKDSLYFRSGENRFWVSMNCSFKVEKGSGLFQLSTQNRRFEQAGEYMTGDVVNFTENELTINLDEVSDNSFNGGTHSIDGIKSITFKR